MSRRRVWITRTQPQAADTAQRVAALGLEPVLAPVLEARPIPGVTPDLAGVRALAFTSGHAVAAFAALSVVRDLSVFAVGDATAARARAAGFGEVRSADGNTAALADLIIAARPGRVLIPMAREPAADLAGLLAARGIEAAPVAVYETVPAGAAPPLADIDLVLIHSPRAAGLVAAHLVGRPEASGIIACAISPVAAAPLERVGLAAVRIAARPTEAALLAALTA
jgi:uroporphyrinogen-III synthase